MTAIWVAGLAASAALMVYAVVLGLRGRRGAR